MTMEEAMKILQMQEEILQFSHFTNGDAWELGHFLIAEGRRRGLPIGVIIKLNNDLTVFQYLSDGMNLDIYEQMCKKANTVKRMEMSTLRLHMKLQELEESLEDRGLNKKDYGIGGGSFPIRVEEVGVVGSITVGGLEHVLNHDFLVKCISKYLHVDEIPRISIVSL